MTFYCDLVVLSLTTAGGPGLKLEIICRALDWQLSSLVQICDSSFLSLFNLERLEIRSAFHPGPHWQEDVENTQWPELLHPFTTVKSLSLSKEFSSLVMPALQELSGERMMDMLPVLQSIFLGPQLSRPVEEAVVQFVNARQLSGHPVAVNPLGQE
jgi:hypothetical protein